MFKKVLSNDSSASLGDEEREGESQGRCSPNLPGPLQVREARMYVEPSVLSVKVTHQYQHRIAR